MPRATIRIVSLAASAALILLGLGPAVIPGSATLAADRGLVLIAQTRYEALPEQRRVHVAIDTVATSYTPNPEDGLAYYPSATFAVQAGATNIAASSGEQPLAVGVDASDPDFVAVTVTFAEGVYFEQSYPFRVTFDLPDPGGAPDRNLRISSSIVAFPIWAFGSQDEPGGSVTVILPGGFRPTVQGEDLTPSIGAGGEIILTSTLLPNPFDFFAYLSADREGAFSDTLLTIQVGGRPAPVKVRSWQDDPEWATTMTGLMTDGLPALQRLIGLPYEAPNTLVVEEAATSRLGDYAGIYNKLSGIIRVRYDADAYVGLHEAAHIWFNGDLFRDRWIGEAWAEFYGVQAAQAIGATGVTFDLTDDLMSNKIPLNDWGEIGGVEIGVEEYAYAASYHLALLIFGRTDVAGLQAVWRGADASEMAYQPANADGDPQIAGDVNLEGWQQLLDLLDQRAGANFDDLWTEWVVNDSEERQLEERSVAREQYAEVAAQAGAWNLPKDLRSSMGSWKFDEAEAAMTLASTVLEARTEIATDAGELQLTPPTELEELFERDGGLKAASAEAELQLEALADISVATDRVAEKETILESIGLLGSNPAADLQDARDAYEAAELKDASREAELALAERSGAAEAGQTRVLMAGGGLVLLTGVTIVGIRFRPRRRVVASTPSAPIEPTEVASAERMDPPA